MLDSHENHPCCRVLPDRKFQGHLENEFIDPFSHRSAIVPHAVDGGPVVVALMKIIPRHLVNADSHYGFYLGVDACGNESTSDQLVYKKNSRMSPVKNQRMAERFVAIIKRFVVLNQRKESIIEFPRFMKIDANLLPLGCQRIGRSQISR